MNFFKLSLGFVLLSICSVGVNAQQNEQKWQQIYQLINDIKEPVFIDKTYNINDFGAVADGQTLNSIAINKAINVCSTNGGGTVLVSDGKYLTGAIHMKNNVNLHIAENAMLIFSTNPKDYLPLVQTRWEGNDCYNYSPLIYANDQHNFAITGKGKLDGQGSKTSWWPWKGKSHYGWKENTPSQLDKTGRPLLTQWDNQQVPLAERQMGEGHFLRPQFISFIHCTNVKIEDITLSNSPFWVIHPVLSNNLILRGVTINSMGPNSDGCDPESCKNVLIENCTFNTGDDCIALKSGRNFDGRTANIPIENVLIRNCKMKNGHGGVVLGSEISAGCKNIFVENCEMSSPELDRAIRIKTNNHRGGTTDGVYIRNVKVGQVKEAVVKINCSYDRKEGDGNFLPMVKNVFISGVHSEKAKYALSLVGIEGENCVENIYIEDCSFGGVESGNKIVDVKNLTTRNITINGEKVELN